MMGQVKPYNLERCANVVSHRYGSRGVYYTMSKYKVSYFVPESMYIAPFQRPLTKYYDDDLCNGNKYEMKSPSLRSSQGNAISTNLWRKISSENLMRFLRSKLL